MRHSGIFWHGWLAIVTLAVSLCACGLVGKACLLALIYPARIIILISRMNERAALRRTASGIAS